MNDKAKRQKIEGTYPGHVFFTWDIKYECNYDCTYCFLKDEPENKSIKAALLSPEEWEKIWRDVYDRYGPCHIAITGGEPFSYPGFLEIIKRINPMHKIEFDTNFSCDVEKFLDSIDVNRVSVGASFHPEHADFDEFLKKIRRLKEAGINDPHITFVAWPPILKDLEGYYKKGKEADIRVFTIVFRGTYNGIRYPEGYTDEERAYLKQACDMVVPLGPENEEQNSSDNNDNKDNRDNENVNGGGDVDKTEEAESKEERPIVCRMGQTYAKILPDGSVWRCCSAGNKRHNPAGFLGNIVEGTFNLLDNPEVCEFQPCACYRCMVIGEEERWDEEWGF